MTEARALTTLEVVGAADRALTGAGYRPINDAGWEAWANSARAYEDEFGVVAVFVFESFEGLDREWINAQTSLVDLMTHHMSRDEAKAWDGYLALLTPAIADGPQQRRANEIRRDTSRVRKLVATRDQINSLAGVGLSLLPLLPLEPGLGLRLPGSALDVLPELLAQSDIPASSSRALVQAFDRQTSLMRALHEGDGQ